MKLYWLILVVMISPFISEGQANLKKVILNKEGVIPSDWVDKIINNGEWEYLKTVAVRRNRLKDLSSAKDGKEWNFSNNKLLISPYNWKIKKQEYSDFSIKYFKANRIITISTTVLLEDRSFERREIYKVINLTSKYLVLEDIKDTYCFDYSKGKILTKKECKEKASKDPKRLIRGGKQINIGRKPPKYRLVFKIKKDKK